MNIRTYVFAYLITAIAPALNPSMGAFAVNSNDSLKILSYNVMHGFEGDSSTIAQYIGWIVEIAPDVVLYQEMNNFTQKKLANLAEKYGHSHSVILNKETGHDATHPLAITSRYPIKNVEMFLDSMWHGYIHAQVEEIDLFVTHLAPFTLKDRQKDTDRIIAHANALPKTSKILIAGDFNALARSDAGQYGASLLASMRKIEGRLEPKSGTPIVKYRTIYRNNLNDGEIDYSVTDRMLGAGFIDAFRFVNNMFKNSVPTNAYLKKSSKLRRIDYAWINRRLSKELVRVEIIQNHHTDSLSDHYPLLITIKKRQQ